MRYQLWTDEETARLLDLVKEGKSFAECGKELNRPRLACLGRYHRAIVKLGHKPVPRKRVLVPQPKPVKPQKPTSGLGFILPAIAPPPRPSHAVGILDVTGCKWPIGEDPRLIGGQAFCDHSKKDGAVYCEFHASLAYDPTVKPLKVKALGPIGLRFGKVAA